MQCPICQKEMTPYKEEPCYDRKKGLVYKRTCYVCREDDVWVRVEIPQGEMTETQKAVFQVVQ